MIPKFQQRYVIPVGEMVTTKTADGYGWVTKEGDFEDWEIEVTINLEKIVRWMGRRAVRSKGGKCVDGHVTVTRRRKCAKQ